jgi:hypothetical protein
MKRRIVKCRFSADAGWLYLLHLAFKIYKTFISTDLTSEATWENYDAAIAKTMDLFSKL